MANLHRGMMSMAKLPPTRPPPEPCEGVMSMAKLPPTRPPEPCEGRCPWQRTSGCFGELVLGPCLELIPQTYVCMNLKIRVGP